MYSTTQPTYAVLDLETTGYDRKEDRIIQIGILKVRNDIQIPWMTYVNPLKKRDSQMRMYSRVHHIPPDLLNEKPTFADVAMQFCTFLEEVEYVVAYNAMFDWSLLIEEFDRLPSNAERYEGLRLLKRIKWIDIYRLSIKTFPDVKDLKAGTLFNQFSIHAQKAQSFHYQLTSAGPQGQNQKEFTLSERGQTNWVDGLHDALCDALATNALLKKLLEINRYSNVEALVKYFPQCCLDTDLLLTLEKMVKQGRTSNLDLLPIQNRVGGYYSTMMSLRGKTLAEIPKTKIETALKSGCEKDRRIILIYRAAILNKPDDYNYEAANFSQLDDSTEEVTSTLNQSGDSTQGASTLDIKPDSSVQEATVLSKPEDTSQEAAISNKKEDSHLGNTVLSMPKDSAQNVMSVNTPEDSTLKRQLPDCISDTPDLSPKRPKED